MAQSIYGVCSRCTCFWFWQYVLVQQKPDSLVDLEKCRYSSENNEFCLDRTGSLLQENSISIKEKRSAFAERFLAVLP